MHQQLIVNQIIIKRVKYNREIRTACVDLTEWIEGNWLLLSKKWYPKHL